MRNMSKVKRRSLGKVRRIQSGKEWAKEYKGSNIINDYRMYFGVNEICAFKDLEFMGMTFDEEYKKKMIEIMVKREEQRKRTKERAKEIKDQKEFESMAEDTNDDFYYIVGYTSGGAAYGVSWDEMGFDSNESYEDKVRKKYKK